MYKSLTWILVVLILSGASTRTAFGWNGGADTQAAKLKSQVDRLPSGASIKVRLKDHGQIEGELGSRSEEGFQLKTPEPVEVSYSEVKAIDEPAGQVSTGGTQGQSTPRHSHLLVKVVIIFAVVFGLTAELVTLDK